MTKLTNYLPTSFRFKLHPIKSLHIRKWLSVWNLVRLSRLIICQWLFTCYKSTLEILEKGVKYSKLLIKLILILETPISQNGQTHSNNSSAIYRRIVWACLTILWGWCLKNSNSYPYLKIEEIKDNALPLHTILEIRIHSNGQTIRVHAFLLI